MEQLLSRSLETRICSSSNPILILINARYSHKNRGSIGQLEAFDSRKGDLDEGDCFWDRLCGVSASSSLV